MTEAHLLDSRAAWARLLVSLAVATVSGVGMWSVVVVMPAVEAEFGVGRGTAALAYTATMVGYALGNLLMGRFVDRFGITRTLILAALAMAAGYVLSATAQDLGMFALAQGLLIGTGAAAGFGPLIADISHWFARRRGVAVAIAASGNYLSGAVWPLILKELLKGGNWRAAHLSIAATCVILIVPLALLLGRAPPILLQPAGSNSSGESSGPNGLSPRALQWLLGLAGVGCCVAMSMPQVHIVALCADLGYGVAAGAEMLALMLTAGIASRLLSGVLSDLIGGIRTLLIGSVLQALALALYVPANGLASLYVVSLVFGLSQGGIVPSYAVIVREHLPAREAGRWVGFVMMATVLGMALGGWMSGWIFDVTGSYQLAFLNGIAFNLLNLAIIFTVFWRSSGPRLALPF